MPRLTSSLIAGAAAFGLSASVYLWRSRELRALQEQLESTRQAVIAGPNRHSSVVNANRYLKDLTGMVPGDPAVERFREELQQLTMRQLDQWCDAALKEPLPESAQQTVFSAIAAAAKKGSDPGAAAILLKLSKSDQKGRSLLEKRIGNWMQSDPAGAVAWVKPRLANGSLAHLRESFRENVKTAVEFIPAMMDPIANLEKIRQAPEGIQGEFLRTGLKYVKTPADRRTLAAAVFTWPDSVQMQQSVPEVLASLVAADGFEETARWLNGLPEVSAGRRTTARVTLAMGQRGNPDIGRHADAMLQQVDEPARAEFAGQLISQWLQQDHRAAAEWINAHHGAAWQDQARQAYARGIASAEPADAITWAASIMESPLRLDTAREIFAAWKGRDPAAASEFLANSTLPGELRQVLEQ